VKKDILQALDGAKSRLGLLTQNENQCHYQVLLQAKTEKLEVAFNLPQ